MMLLQWLWETTALATLVWVGWQLRPSTWAEDFHRPLPWEQDGTEVES